MKHLLLLLLISVLQIESFSQVNLNKVLQLKSTSNLFIGGLHQDNEGNTFVGGFYVGNADFDPGVGQSSNSSNTVRLPYICKLDSLGNLVWIKEFTAKQNGRVEEIRTDSQGNVYAVGLHGDSTDFDPGVGTSYLNGDGGFIVKLRKNGDFAWVRPSPFFSYGLSVGSLNEIYIGGFFSGSITLGGTSLSSSGGGNDIFFAKLDSSGSFSFAKQIGSISEETLAAIEVDHNGDFYLTGTFENTVDFDPNLGVSNLTSIGGKDIYLSKYNSSGDFLWGNRKGSNSLDQVHDLAIDRFNNPIITGTIYNPNNLNFGAYFAFTNKYDSFGSSIWNEDFTSAPNDWVSNQSLSVDIENNILITGFHIGTGDFDPSSATFNLNSVASSRDAYVCKLSQSGSFIWAYSLGGSGSDVGLEIVSKGNQFVLGGTFEQTVDFDPSINIDSLTNTPFQPDIFLANFTDNTVTNLIESSGLKIDVNIYPNPADEYIKIDSKLPIGRVQIYSNLGFIVKSTEQKRLFIGDLSHGTYIVEIITQLGTRKELIIKQ